MDYIPEPTVRPVAPFNVAEDGAALRGAMKGLGTDEQAIIDILTKRSNSQRQQIAEWFNNEYGRDLIDDLKSELGGKFEDVIIALMTPPVDYLAKQLHKAMEGMGTEEGTMVEIICPRTNREIKEIVEAYERLYDRPLAEHLCSETGGEFRRLLTLLLTGVREEFNIDPAKAQEDAEALFNAGEGQWGTDEHVFNRILTHDSHAQLKLVFQQYKEVSGGRCIEEALRNEVSGDLQTGLLAIVDCVQDKPLYFARRIHEAMDGAGTDDITLIRLIVTRSEIDLGTIKKTYEKIYDKSLESAIKSETSGDYKHALLAIIGCP